MKLDRNQTYKKRTKLVYGYPNKRQDAKLTQI